MAPPQRKMSRQERSGERAGQFPSPPCIMHLSGYAVSYALRLSALNVQGLRHVGTTYEPLCWLKHFAVELYILTYDDLRRTMFSSIVRVTADIRERFQQWQNLTQKYAFLRPEVKSSMEEFILDPVPEDIIKGEFQLERVRLQTVVAATDTGCKKETR
ncbi:uncharacterized protein TNCV_2159091 [Trichonephila clavipes]|nr:uncharacterized protein TNCV_2159091 [Trichonephila clavipes]